MVKASWAAQSFCPQKVDFAKCAGTTGRPVSADLGTGSQRWLSWVTAFLLCCSFLGHPFPVNKPIPTHQGSATATEESLSPCPLKVLALVTLLSQTVISHCPLLTRKQTGPVDTGTGTDLGHTAQGVQAILWLCPAYLSRQKESQTEIQGVPVSPPTAMGPGSVSDTEGSHVTLGIFPPL